MLRVQEKPIVISMSADRQTYDLCGLSLDSLALALYGLGLIGQDVDGMSSPYGIELLNRLKLSRFRHVLEAILKENPSISTGFYSNPKGFSFVAGTSCTRGNSNEN